MTMSQRAALALGLGLLGASALVVPSWAQSGSDAQARKASTSSQEAAPAAARPAPAIIGSVDMDAVFKGYNKVKDQSERLKTDAMAKQAELVKISGELQKITEAMKGFTPGSSDFKKYEGQYTKLKATFEAEREQAQHSFAEREAETLAALYKEVQAVVARVAQAKGMTFIVKISNEPISGSDPNSVMAGMARSIVYSDPSTDITKTVLATLNYYYDQNKPAAPKAAAGTDAAPAPPVTKGQ